LKVKLEHFNLGEVTKRINIDYPSFLPTFL